MKDYITHAHTVQSTRIYNLPYTNTAPQDVLSSMMECIYAGSHHCCNYMDVILINTNKWLIFKILYCRCFVTTGLAVWICTYLTMQWI